MRNRCGNSNVAIPWGLSSRAKPATKSLMSGTCASTLLAAIRSAWRPCGGQFVGQRHAEEALDDLDAALARAAAAVLAVGSMP